MTDTQTRGTIESILEGAMRALARHGPARLSMTDICRESGVSRGTLYRYFASRDEVLDAVNLHLFETSRDTFQRAVDANPDPDQRVQVILHAMLDFPNRFPHMRMMFEYEPKVSLEFLTAQMGEVIEVLVKHLEPALEGHPVADAGVLTARDLAEFLYRIVTSAFLIPASEEADIEAKVAALWKFGLESRKNGSPRRRPNGAHQARG